MHNVAGIGQSEAQKSTDMFNLPELINIWKGAADIQTADMLNLPVPEALHTTVVTKPSEFQTEMGKDLADRANSVRKKEVEPNVDNMLRITSDGRKLALDQGLQNDLLPDDENSKINTCVNNVFDIWEQSTDTRGAQLIFCDLSTPHYDGTFNVYDDIKNKLMEKGVPPEEINFIHDANIEQQKAKLFAKVRSGDVCVLNENKEIKIFKYVTENTFDILLNSKKKISRKFCSTRPLKIILKSWV